MARLFGFLLGTSVAGGGLYYYVIDEYKVSNELLTEDIYVRSPSRGLEFVLDGALDTIPSRSLT